MKFTLAQLYTFLDTNSTLNEILNALNQIGLEVESVTNLQDMYANFIVAQIESAAPHPNAAKLQVCTVFDGLKTRQVVCGAHNARAGIKVVLADINAIVPESQLLIKPSTIRGVESNGMLCSAEELSLNDDKLKNDGIIELDDNYAVGQHFATQYGICDVVIDVSITPNRGDAASVIGIARDLSAKGLGTLKAETTKLQVFTSAKDLFEIQASHTDVMQFHIVEVNNVDNNIQLQSLRQTMRNLGHSDNSVLVDVSNYFMLQYGQPNHIYDKDQIKGKLYIRYAKDGEKFLALNNIEYSLPSTTLVIADDEKVCAIAGVIGGELCKVTPATKSILIEVAQFNPNAVSQAGRYFNINTDSRYRFERGIDIEMPSKLASYLCDYITTNLNGMPICSQHYCNKNNVTTIQYRFEDTKNIIGIDIPEATQIDILNKLGFDVKLQQNGVYNIIVPSYRTFDIKIQEDVAEEIIRMYGLENLPTKPLISRAFQASKLYRVKQELTSIGLNEIITWSFCSIENCMQFSIANPIALLNPISPDKAYMRQTLLQTMIEASLANHKMSYQDIWLFEEGRVYKSKDDGEVNSICGLRLQFEKAVNWQGKQKDVDFYTAKADFFTAIAAFGFDPTKLMYDLNVPAYYHPSQSAAFYLGKTLIGYVGMLHPKLQHHLDLPKLCAFELFYDDIPTAKNQNKKFQKHNLQSIYRDFAFIVEKDLDAEFLVRAIKSSHKELISEVVIFDVFANIKDEPNLKSIGLRVSIQPKDKPLDESALEYISNTIINSVKNKCNAILR